MKNRYFLAAVALLLLLSGCSKKAVDENESPSSTKLLIYTTVYPLQYFTERIGGEFVDVQSIYPPGTDEHVFEPTQKDMMSLAKADLFFYVGLGLEGFVQKTEKTLQNEHVQLVSIADDIDPEELEPGHSHDHEGHSHEHEEEDHNHDHGHDSAVDPHVWISPFLSTLLAEKIKDELTDELPEHADQFQENFDTLYDDLEKLDRQYKTMADEAPNKTFFVSHAAFGYLADTYGLQQLAVSGLDSQNEPSQKQLAALVQEAKEKDIQYILFEQNVSSKLAEVIQKELNAEVLTLHNLSVLTNEDIDNDEDYFSLMEQNLQVLKKALSN
ncbi:metal ABC transporter solute-binding protein, Zn/Mn family [Sporosarcina newyorkensis]|uniref:Zinc transport system substrate-binding protein n=2 Tax=Sporosarcina newyorkensis TaxID=759851 RepID=A0A1T4YM58_9BACL|nr:zinc ABC transporter substrate-binding protein [Sporosarcina newyorkensis]EGQ21472.1 ABC superfamily ATP binding cassette transporter, binding protein [Sporosarcina newyorkensis 2681]SKB02773.1 zinc transport system substrate-binding protein [Sporosarcina newyorkensis]